MLSFMKEESGQSPDVSSKDSQAVKPAGQTESSAEKDNQDFLVPSASDKKVKYSTYALVGLFALGLLGLFMMIKKSTPTQAQAALSQQDLKIERAISKLVGSRTQLNERMGEVVKKIDNISNIEQIEVDQLKRNPFRLQSLSSAGKIDLEKLKGKDDGLSLRLWSVMDRGGSKSCMINDKILKINDSIDGYTINQIGEGFVELSSEKGSIVLRISE